ncbi:hypothetical protein RvY_13810 [Ramazzottius varieornatus]|uniref:Glucosidase II beta subunit N-terminal domain-containing protein n=1 Tax=Ramazzottius varieornatus TaxID=947166 RepID=A0A1D1VQZ5_RAMVA|nr:hypothetical protein RvY_13810 [Ramazzottius varieornatus]
MKTEPRKEQLRPLGVVAGRTAQLVGMDPKYYVYYKTASKSGKFKCISSKEVIPWSHVNDNYCDCPEDGSDEPATTACSFFAPHQYFFCTSTDPSKIPVAWMNDGICDCCAGEDETEKYCPNTCKSLKPRRQHSWLELERPYNRSYLYPAVIVDAAYSTTHRDILALGNAFYDPIGDELYPNAAATHFLRNQCDRPSAENVSALKRQYERKNEAYFPLELDELVKQLLKRFNGRNHRLFDSFTKDQLQHFANVVDPLVPLLMEEFTDVVKNTIEEIETQQELDEYSDDTDQDDDANSRPID